MLTNKITFIKYSIIGGYNIKLYIIALYNTTQ